MKCLNLIFRVSKKRIQVDPYYEPYGHASAYMTADKDNFTTDEARKEFMIGFLEGSIFWIVFIYLINYFY